MPAFKMIIHPSKWLFWLVVILHVLTLLAILMHSMMDWAIGWLLCWLLSVLWAWRGYKHAAVRAIVIDVHGQAWLRLGSSPDLTKAQLHHHSLARSSLLSLRWKTECGTIYQLLLPDMVDKQAWRRLQVWVRWCQPTGQHESDFIN